MILLLPSNIMAQSVSTAATEEEKANALARIEKESDNRIEFDIPDWIINNLFSDKDQPKKANHEVTLHPGINKLAGYRIQIFSDGRNQTTLEKRARARGNAVVARFPKYRGQVYTQSAAPNWYTRIGNFKNQAEASAALQELKNAFPEYAGEMRVVRSQIMIIK